MCHCAINHSKTRWLKITSCILSWNSGGWQSGQSFCRSHLASIHMTVTALAQGSWRGHHDPPTCLAFGASHHLGALLLLHVGMCPLAGWALTAWWRRGLKRTKARGARSLKDQAPEFTEQFIGQKLSPDSRGKKVPSLYWRSVCM